MFQSATFCLILLLPTCLAAQSTETGLQARLLNSPLYLRGQWRENKLKFDGAGQLLGTSATVPFTLSGIDVLSISLSDKVLKLDGTRVGIIFKKDLISRTEIAFGRGATAKPEHVHLEITAPANGDYGVALDRIFTSDLATFVPTMPLFWQEYGMSHFLHASLTDLDQATVPVGTPPVPETKPRRISGGVLPPEVLYAPQVSYDEPARNAKLSGSVLVYLQVNPQGKPIHVRILRPLGLGLDELAISSVLRYEFKPAELNGTAVLVEMNVEVHFEMLF